MYQTPHGDFVWKLPPLPSRWFDLNQSNGSVIIGQVKCHWVVYRRCHLCYANYGTNAKRVVRHVDLCLTVSVKLMLLQVFPFWNGKFYAIFRWIRFIQVAQVWDIIGFYPGEPQKTESYLGANTTIHPMLCCLCFIYSKHNIKRKLSGKLPISCKI